MNEFLPNSAILTGSLIQSSAADNATATATLNAIVNAGARGKYFLTGVEAHYSAAVALIKTITINYTDQGGNAVAYTMPWDFTNGDLIVGFPGIIACKEGTGVTATLTGSGTGGTTGQITLFYFMR